MKRLLALPLVCLGLYSCVAIAEDADSSAANSDADTVVLYGGGELSGWIGRQDLWSAEDGEIVGRTTDEKPIQGNTFLIYDKEKFSDFELTAQFKIQGGNSGIQYRSRVVDPDEYVVAGYQADIDSTNKFSGILYEEKARGILALRGQKVTMGADGEKTIEQFGDSEKIAAGIHPGKWNEYRIVADGNHLQHYINGVLTAEVIDNQSEKAAESGIIALQLHRGPAMTVRFKNIKLRKL